MNALSQLRKWELIFQCVLVHQDNTIRDNNCNLGDNNTGADCEYELKVNYAYVFIICTVHNLV